MQHSPLVMRRNSARTPGGERKRNVAEGNVPTAKADWEEETVGEALHTHPNPLSSPVSVQSSHRWCVCLRRTQ